MEHIEIPPHVQRLREEHEQMEQRLRNLNKFIGENSIFGTLHIMEQTDMIRQCQLMHELEIILSRRLERALKDV